MHNFGLPLRVSYTVTLQPLPLFYSGSSVIAVPGISLCPFAWIITINNVMRSIGNMHQGLLVSTDN